MSQKYLAITQSYYRCYIFEFVRYDEGATIVKTTLLYETGQNLNFIGGNGVQAPFAADVRNGKVSAIDVHFE